MITIFNPTKLTGQPFFKDLINYLNSHDEVILRHIKRDFPEVKNLDKQLEDYIQAGYILRENKRYRLNLPLLETVEEVTLDSHIMVDTESPVYGELLALSFETVLANQTNDALIVEASSLTREELTLANYFHKLRTAQPFSEKQEKLYEILGDVNPEYALKYMTTFLLKFARKNEVKQKRRDIFVDALELLGYVEKIAEQTYGLGMAFDADTLTFTRK
ncbi:DUF1803 domain-containing protein [Streptococcus hillyeri]|uniref:DUF1803 domain-containing protein n=1 Tax=Streptococcus hillyeri TaxID=2282420 RepID=A0A3L9DZH6_9STRE|nr:DUF1803 domain-containing protein [Streptococcus hillyeri]RLY04220.1 DUF1803 domain-containing protein [Streptococcus hillyeri]